MAPRAQAAFSTLRRAFEDAENQNPGITQQILNELMLKMNGGN